MARRAPALLRGPNFVPFIILSRSRSGSNLLASYLNSHPRAYVEGEILGRLGDRSVAGVIDRAFGPQSIHLRAKGFKIFYYHPVDDDSGEVWRQLLTVPELRVIQLRRLNLLEVVVSRKLAETTNTWIDAGHARPSPKAQVHLSVPEILQDFEKTVAWERQGRERFSQRPLLAVTYEEMVQNPGATFDRVTDFLSLHPRAPRTMFRRQNPEALSAKIANYDEIRSALQGGPWASFVETV